MNETNTLDEVLLEYSEDQYSDTYTVDFSGHHSNVSLSSPYTISSGINFPNAVYTASTVSSPWVSQSPLGSTKIQLHGEGADIEVNGWSLVDAVKRIEERLNLLTPNTKLEAEWKELKVLGDQYRELEQQIKDKQATWDRLKAMPPPEID